MATVSFTCPKCKKVLRTGNTLPAGKKVKCPGCATIFTVPAQPVEEDLDTGIQSKTSPAAPKRKTAPPPPPPDDDDEDDHRPRKRRRPEPVDEDDEDEAPRKARKRRDDDDDVEDEDEDDRPRRRKSKKKKAGSNLALILGLAGGGLVLVIVLLTGFVWPGFFISGGGVGGAGDLLAFVPAQSDFVAGANLTALRSRPGTLQEIEQLAPLFGMNPAQLELIKTADRGIVAAVKNTNQTIGAFNSQNPIDPEKVRQAFNGGPAETVDGKVIYPIQGASGIWFSLPDPKIVVVGGNMDKNAFVQILKGQNRLSANLQSQAAALRQSSVWFAVDLQGGLKGEMQQGLGAAPPPIQTAIRGAPSVGFAMDITQGAKLQLGLQCANNADAAQVETEVNKLKDQLQGLAFLALQVPELKGAADDIVKSFKVEKQGAKVIAKMELTENSLKSLEKINPGNIGLGLGGGASAEVELQNNLKNLGLAMHNYQDTYQSLPSPTVFIPMRNPNLSWRVNMLPFVENVGLYQQFKFDEPWDGPNNIKLLDKMPAIFAPLGKQPKGNVKGGTYIQLITGPGTLYPQKDTKAKIPGSFPDGTSNTILIVEAGTLVPWTKPDDIVLTPGQPLPKLGAFHPHGFYAAMGDTTIRFVDTRKVSEKTIRLAINPADGLPLPADWGK